MKTTTDCDWLSGFCDDTHSTRAFLEALSSAASCSFASASRPVSVPSPAVDTSATSDVIAALSSVPGATF